MPQKKHPGSRLGTSSKKRVHDSHSPCHSLCHQVNGSHGTFPATCARPASRMHFYEAYYSCSYYCA